MCPFSKIAKKRKSLNHNVDPPPYPQTCPTHNYGLPKETLLESETFTLIMKELFPGGGGEEGEELGEGERRGKGEGGDFAMPPPVQGVQQGGSARQASGFDSNKCSLSKLYILLNFLKQ